METLANRYVLSREEPRVGGMAVVRRAADTLSELRPVAIKFMETSRVTNDEVIRESFNRELAALNSLKHTNIVEIIDFDPLHDPPYIVLEWLDQDLASFIDERKCRDWDDFYDRIGRPILEALNYALGKRITHRDLKPGNVLVDSNGTPKLADFGISKFYERPINGLTLGSYKSEPYAPFQEHVSQSSRDAYSFAVLALRCLYQQEFISHESVNAALGSVEVPDEIKTILAQAISVNPNDRFSSVVELYSGLEDVWEARHTNTTESDGYIFITASAVTKLSDRLEGREHSRTRRLIEQEIDEQCTFFFWQDRRTQEKSAEHFLGLTSRLRLHLTLDERAKDHFVLLNAWYDESEKHEAFIEHAFKPRIKFRFSRPPNDFDGVAAMRSFIDALTQHELDDVDKRRTAKYEQILTGWANTLRFRQQFEEGQHSAIPYTDCKIDGNRVFFQVASNPKGVEVDQPRLVEHEHRTVLSGIVDKLGWNYVVLWIERGVAIAPPKKGRLLYDNRASRVALNRQRSALDAIRYGQCVRPSLRNIVLDPALARPTNPPEGIEWVHEEFDLDKKLAVGKALGAEDVLVINGPPGTGKTRLITELIAQILKRSPASKILLTSQTHVALDNALERLHELRPDVPMLRVANEDDSRVAPAVKKLTTEHVAKRWRSDIAKRSERFLSSVAEKLSVNRDDLNLGIAVARLHVEALALDDVSDQLSLSETALYNAEQKLQTANVAGIADGYHDTRELIEELKEQAQELREQRKTVSARHRKASKDLAQLGEMGAELANSTTEELAEWQESLLNDSEETQTIHSFIRLSEEWQLRFGRSRELYSAIVAESSVVAGTCLGFASIRGMDAAEFDVCIVDEASKSTATELLVPLSRAKRWILVGDPKQLPPFVEDLLENKNLLRDYDLDRDTFQKTLLDRFLESLPADCIASLTTQHRMIQPIGDLVSECFYDGGLTSIRLGKNVGLLAVLPAPVTWFTTAKIPRHHETFHEGTYKNIAEARFIGRWIKRLDFMAGAASRHLRIAVITGYVGQLTELHRTIAQLQKNLEHLDVECNTVDAFQGREADICVYSVTRCNSHRKIGFLRDARRMNVALSRGRDGLVIVGDHTFCRNAQGPNPLGTVVGYIEQHPDDCIIQDIEQ